MPRPVDDDEFPLVTFTTGPDPVVIIYDLCPGCGQVTESAELDCDGLCFYCIEDIEGIEDDED